MQSAIWRWISLSPYSTHRKNILNSALLIAEEKQRLATFSLSLSFLFWLQFWGGLGCSGIALVQVKVKSEPKQKIYLCHLPPEILKSGTCSLQTHVALPAVLQEICLAASWDLGLNTSPKLQDKFKWICTVWSGFITHLGVVLWMFKKVTRWHEPPLYQCPLACGTFL